MSAPRVLVCGAVLSQPMGGVRRHNQEILPRAARLLSERGGRLAVLVGTRGLAFELAPDVERLPSNVPPGPPWLRALFEGAALLRAVGTRPVARFDVVHTAHLPAPLEPPAALTLLLHDLKAFEPGSSLASRVLLAAALRAALARAAAVCTVSASLADELCAHVGCERARIRVVPNAADHLPLLPRAAEAAAPLVCVGHLERRKNVEVLLRALALDRDLPRLVLAGAARNGEGERLRELALRLGVLARVEFAGQLDDARLSALYARAACVVLPSRREGFGIPALEARRAGAPLCVARTPALVEVAGPQAPTFAPDDPAECARAVRAALSISPEALERAAREALRATWDDSAARLVEVWSQVAAAR